MLTFSAQTSSIARREHTFIGTSSPVMNANDCWPDAASPISVVPAMSWPTLCAVAETIQPMRARAAAPMKNHWTLVRTPCHDTTAAMCSTHPPAEQIAQTAYENQANGECQGVHERDPYDIGIWTNVAVDEGQVGCSKAKPSNGAGKTESSGSHGAQKEGTAEVARRQIMFVGSEAMDGVDLLRTLLLHGGRVFVVADTGLLGFHGPE